MLTTRRPVMRYVLFRMTLLLYVMVARSVFVIWEQPKGSAMEYHPRFQSFLKFRMLYRQYTKLWDYGADSEKGFWLYSQFRWIEQITQFCTGSEDFAIPHLSPPPWYNTAPLHV